MRTIPQELAARARAELAGNILPFWLALWDPVYGGHFSSMDYRGRVDANATKTSVFTARLLWTFSEAARVLGHADCRMQAEASRNFLLRHFWQTDGFIWSVARDGTPVEGDKHLYAQAFCVYALAAYARMASDAASSDLAHALCERIQAARNPATGLYYEAFDVNWRPIGNHRRALTGVPAAHTVDTHLHLLEATTALAGVAPRARLREMVVDLIEVILARFIASDGAFAHPIPDEAARPVSGPLFPGHDIELSWLLDEAADVLGDADLSIRCRLAASNLARGAMACALGSDGGWAERVIHGKPDRHRPWWVQAEAVIGVLNEAERSGSPDLLATAWRTWRYIERCFVDQSGGDWHLRVDHGWFVRQRPPKVVFWKDPYHQARACLRLIARGGVPSGVRRPQAGRPGGGVPGGDQFVP